MTDDGLTLITGWKRLGLTDEQVADNMGVAYSTLRVWRDDYSAIKQALKEGKEVTDFHVMNALYQNALNGNVTAQIFFLKNRMPDHFKDRVEYTDTKSLDKLDKVLEAVKEQVNEPNE